MVFCLGGPGLNPRTDLGFFLFRSAVNLLSLVVFLYKLLILFIFKATLALVFSKK